MKTGFVLLPFTLSDSGSPEVNGVYEYVENSQHLIRNDTEFDVIFYQCSSGCRFRFTSVFLRQDEPGMFTNGRVYRLTFTLENSVGTVFYRYTEETYDGFGMSLFLLLFGYYFHLLNELVSGLEPFPLTTGYFPFWQLETSSATVRIILQAEQEGNVVISSTTDDEHAENTLVRLSSGVDTSVEITHGRERIHLQVPIVYRTGASIIDNSSFDTDQGGFCRINKIVLSDSGLTEISSLITNVFQKLSYLDISGNCLSEGKLSSLVANLVEYVPDNGYLDISNQTTDEDPDSSLQTRIADLRNKGWTVITD